jgi:hypothetical protein
MTAFAQAVFAAWKSPDAWDAFGADFTGAEQAFKTFGELVEKLRSGALNAFDVQQLDSVARYFSTSLATIAGRVSSIDVPP